VRAALTKRLWRGWSAATSTNKAKARHYLLTRLRKSGGNAARCL
jgi:hypothetical protein